MVGDGKSNSGNDAIKYLEKQVDELKRIKADDTRVTYTEKLADEAKDIALIAKRKAEEQHACIQSDRIEKMEECVMDWSTWFRRGAIGFIVFILTVGGGLLWQHFTLTSSVEAQRQSVSEIKSSVETMKSSTRKTKTAVEEGFGKSESDNKIEAEKQLAMIKEALKMAIQEADEEKKKPRRGRSEN